MKRTGRRRAVAVLIVAFCCSLQALSAEKAVICNDTVWRDTSGQEVWCNGGHMIREGDRFYWVGYETRPRTGFRNIKLYSSTNLADWRFENDILRNEGPLSILGWAGRPGLLLNRTMKKYVVVFEADSRQWERHKVGFACCDAVHGNYEFVRYVYPEGNRSTGDQSVYQEQDEAYLVCTLDKLIEGQRYLNQSLAIFKLTPDYLDIEKKVYEGFDNVNGDTSIYPRHHTSREASHIIKVDGVYYWFSSGLQGWNSTATMYATASALAGPWSELRVLATEPVSPDSFNTQHDFVIPITGTQATTYVYVGDRYSQHHGRGTGRNIFLPLVWDSGVPKLTWCSQWGIDTRTGRWETVVPVVRAGPRVPWRPKVEIEEDVYNYEPADNGAGPMWCHGSTCLVHSGDGLFASGLETIPGARPLNNCRWMLFQRGPEGWRKVCFDAAGRTREPSPLAGFPDGRLFLSANPTLNEDPNAYAGPARPELLEFDVRVPSRPARTLAPVWSNQPQFTEHSYRSLAADGPNRELILFQNVGYTHAEWTFLDRRGRWNAQGQLEWPWGSDYSKPQPIRVCYPNVALRDREVHFCGVSDIVEPNEQWRAFKRQLTGREWDYDFRRLFYTWSPDITTGRFQPWVEIASREKTCGWISPGDLWAAPDGRVHILWTERALDERLRERFFPGARQSHSLNYAVVRQGEVLARHTLLIAEEGQSNERAGQGRFHVAPDNRLFVLFYVSGSDRDGRPVSENRLLEILPDGSVSNAVRVPLEQPFPDFMTATPRAGSPPSRTLELLGTRQGAGTTISFARIRVE